MADILFIALLIGFFALSVVLVRACEHILGDAEVVPIGDDRAEPEQAAA